METKPWYTSLTLWGTAVMTVCGLLLPLIGKADIAKTIQEGQVDILNALTAFGTAIGAVMTVIGRFKVKTILTK